MFPPGLRPRPPAGAPGGKRLLLGVAVKEAKYKKDAVTICSWVYIRICPAGPANAAFRRYCSKCLDEDTLTLQLHSAFRPQLLSLGRRTV